VAAASDSGDFEVFGLKVRRWWMGIAMSICYEASAFLVSEDDGRVLCASRRVEVSAQRRVELRLFRCGSVVLYGVLVDTGTLRPVEVSGGRGIRVVRSRSSAEVSEWSLYLVRLGALGQVAILTLPCGVELDVEVSDPKAGTTLLLLRGLRLEQGESLAVHPWEAAHLTLNATWAMLAPLLEDPTLRHSMAFAKECYEEALRDYAACLEGLRGRDSARALALGYRALHSARRAYQALAGVHASIAAMNALILLLLAPFSLVVSELIPEGRRLRRGIGAALAISLAVGALALTHPGFRLHPCLPLLISSAAALATGVLGLALLAAEGCRAVSELRAALLGKHFAGAPRLTLLPAALSISARGMRRRPLRTALTTLTVACMVVSVVLLSSWRYGDVALLKPLSGARPSYSGLLVREWPIDLVSDGQAPIPRLLVEYVRGLLPEGAELHPRARLAGSAVVSCPRTGRQLGVRGSVVGLLPGDPAAPEGALLEGCWPKPGTMSAAISEDLAEALGVELGDAILLGSLRLTVVGIISLDVFCRLKELDGYLVTPLFLTREGIVQESSCIVVVPFDVLLGAGGVVTSVLVRSANSSSLLALAEELARQVGGEYQVYFSDGESSYELTCVARYELSRPESFLLPFALLCLTLSNAVLGSMHERRRDLRIYAALGMSPGHVALVALAEGLAYSALGVTLGYLAATVVSWAAQLAGLALPLDVSAPHLPVALLLSIAAVLLSSAYPSLEASREVTPSLARRWRPLMRPLGSEWHEPLPVRVTSAREAWGLARFLCEYFESVHCREFAVVEGPAIEEREGGSVAVTLTLMPAPQDAGVLARVEVVASPTAGGMALSMRSRLVRGKRYIWVASYRGLVDRVRKQLLIWRSLSPEERARYVG